MSRLTDTKLINRSIAIVATMPIQDLVERSGEHFEMECFTAIEHTQSTLGSNRIEYFAGRFAAKQAILRVLGGEWDRGLSWLDIEVQRLPTGKPSIVLYGACKEIAAALGIMKWLLSISHTSSYAVASVFALGNKMLASSFPERLAKSITLVSSSG